jgi:peptidyl-dipeptidase Dcp
LTVNPLLSESPLPYRLPPFTEVAGAHFLPAFEQGMAEQAAEVAAIVADPEPPTFANTVEALERSGQLLRRAEAVFFTLTASHATDEVRSLEAEIAPRLTRHRDALLLDRGLFTRLSQVESDDSEEAWLLEKYRTDFVRAGAELDEAEQVRLRSVNEELTTLATEFAQHLLAAKTESALVVDDEALLDGLSSAAIEAARQDDGTFVLPLLNFTNQPALAELTDRDTRRRLFELSISRAPENLPLAARMAALRAERAALLGFPNHAAYAVADQTAKTTDAVEDMLGQLVGPAVANVEREAETLSALAGFPIEPWDWAFYAERVRRESYAFDAATLRPYFELERVYHDGIFRAATQLYGLTFEPRPELSGYLPEVQVFEVYDADGSGLGLFLLDPYARPTKRGGAWMHHLVDQSHLVGLRPVVCNNLNVTKPSRGPTLLTYDEVTTAFHEFGHALHGLLSDVRFPRVSGTSVPRDFVEFPSQVNEMWVTWPSVLASYARHHETDDPVPTELLEKLEAAAAFNQGFQTVEYLGAALLDWAWHSLPASEPVTDPSAFETEALERFGIAHRLVPPRYRTSYFAHIFTSGVGGYSAGYYSYIWSEVLDAESVEWFKANGGLDRANGDHFRTTLLSVGGSRDVMDAFRDFRGADPRIEPLLVRRGLVPRVDDVTPLTCLGQPASQ